MEIAVPDVPDTVGPFPPKDFRAAQHEQGVLLRWLPALDEDSGTVSYQLFRDGVHIATIPAGERGDDVRRRRARRSYAYQLRAVDAAGNVGAMAKTGVTWVDAPAPPDPDRPKTDDVPTVPAPDRVKPTLTPRRRSARRPSRLPGRKLKVTGRDDRAGVTVTVTVSGKAAKLRKGVLQLTVKQAKRSTIKITVTDAAGNRTTTTLKVRSGRATGPR